MGSGTQAQPRNQRQTTQLRRQFQASSSAPSSTTSLAPNLSTTPTTHTHEGNWSCRHSLSYQIILTTPLCGLCFLRDYYKVELPKRLHLSRVLAENGNPQQAPALLTHISVIEGIKAPTKQQTLRDFRRARSHIIRSEVRGFHQQMFPVASALWELMGYQPPLAEPLALAVQGHDEEYIAAKLTKTTENIVERLSKGIPEVVRMIRKYDGKSKESRFA